MEANSSTPTTDILGRRSDPRRRRSEAEKWKIVEEALQPCASVALVARRQHERGGRKRPAVAR